jgi:hypothetical protein
MYKVSEQIFWDIRAAEYYAKMLSKLTGKQWTIERI